MYSSAGIHPIIVWCSCSAKDTHINGMMALTWDKHPLVKIIYSMQRFGNAATLTVNIPLNIQSWGLRTPGKASLPTAAMRQDIT
jgi:hypothetical protein